MHVLLIFLDGVGLGADDATANPFAAAHFPTLTALANGQRWLAKTGRQNSPRAAFIPTDTRLGVPGRPQSGSNQAVIVTGRNIPRLIGQHYGPKPNAAIRELLDEDNLFTRLKHAGKRAALLEAYPPRWHLGIDSGKSLPSSYQYALRTAGIDFFGIDDLIAGRALSGDWTGEGWHTQLKLPQAPLRSAYEAGRALVQMSRAYDFAFFSHWLTDVIGHRGTLQGAVEAISTFDEVMCGVLDEWDDHEGLVIITSDHGNIEDISHGKHTENDVPTVVIGAAKEAFAEGLHDLTGIAPRIEALLYA